MFVFILFSFVMRGILELYIDFLRDFLECLMGENLGGRKFEIKIILLCFVNKIYYLFYRMY